MTSVSSYPDLENKVVLITGASSGIGASTAKYFAGQKSRSMFVLYYFVQLNILVSRLSLVARNLPALDFVPVTHHWSVDSARTTYPKLRPRTQPV